MSVFPILECVSLVLSSFAVGDKPQLPAPAAKGRSVRSSYPISAGHEKQS